MSARTSEDPNCLKLKEHVCVYYIMNALIGQLNNREWATLFWLGVFLIWFFGNRERRNLLQPYLWALLNSLLDKTILIIVLLMVLYISLSVIVLEQVGIWNATSDLKDTILWSITVAFVMMMRIGKVQKDDRFFRKTVSDLMKFTIILEFVVGLYPFSLPVELILTPVLVSLGILIAISETKKEYLPAKKLLGWLLGLLGVVILGHAIQSLLADMDSFVGSQWLIELLWPFILTLLFLPFIYSLALFVAYENVFVGLSSQNRDSKLIGYAKRTIALSFGFHLRKLLKWSRRHTDLKFNNKEALLNLIEEPIQPAKDETASVI